MSVHQLKDGRWIVKIPDPSRPGGSRRKYFGRGSIAESRARAHDRSLDLRRTRPAAQDSGPMFRELAYAYSSHKGFTPNNLRRLTINLNSVILPAFGDIPAIRLTHADLDHFVSVRRRAVKDTTIKHDVAVIQAVLNWSASRRPPLIPVNPLRGFHAPVPDDEVILPPTIAEITAILKHANERLKRFIYLAWYCGMRPGGTELLSLTYESILWETGVIRVISARKGGIMMREVPIHPAFLPELKAWSEMDGNTGPIIKHHGQRIYYMDWSWRKAKKAAGIIRRLRLYDLRHLFVTSAIESGADYKTLSEIVGSSPETLRKYYQHVSTEARVRLIESMPELPVTFDNHLAQNTQTRA